MYKNGIKRLIDIVLSGMALLILWFPMLIIALLVKCDSKGPVFFWQKRVGIHKETFMMPKFRSMYTETPANMPTHPSAGHNGDTLANGLTFLFAQRGEPFVFRPVSRLDRNTSGIITGTGWVCVVIST